MNRETTFLIDVVRKASLLIHEDFEVKAKGDKGDLVTNLDYEVEKYIIERVKTEYPNFDIVSEEYNSKKEVTKNCFTIDPIDGTINFAHHLPLWGIQVACIKDGEVCAAVIFLPKLNELYYADETGAYLNDKKISVNQLGIEKGLYTMIGHGKILENEQTKKIKFHCRMFHCSAVGFSWVACGKLSAIDFIWDTAWDYIPGEYLVKQAGGIIYNEKNKHIVANNEEFLKFLNENIIIDK